jgi:hypothetical protein
MKAMEIAPVRRIQAGTMMRRTLEVFSGTIMTV